MIRPAILLALLLALALPFWPQKPPAQAAPVRDELLRIESRVHYDVRPALGPPHITWQVELLNNDPETQARDAGLVFFYQNFSLPVLRGASAVQASGPGGVALPVAVDQTGAGPLTLATITFDRELYFGDRYSFTLSYDLVEIRSETLLVTEAYVYLPAIVIGDPAAVIIETPAGEDWDVSIDPIDCVAAGSAGEFQCSASDDVQVAALIEVSRPGALESMERSIGLQDAIVELTVFHFPGEESWGTRILQLAIGGLPLLETLFGQPYPGPALLTVSERGRQQIAGYEGTFGCQEGIGCAIGISPVAHEFVTLHEFAHLWTQVFAKRWIAEGLAEFMSRKAAIILPVEIPEQATPPPGIELALDDWGSPSYLIQASDEERAREDTGYRESRRLFEALEAEIGLAAIQAANAAAAELSQGIDSERYLDILEDTSGAVLDGLFLERVFPASYAPTLEQRRRVRAQLDGAEDAAEAAGLQLPALVGLLVDDWDFAEAGELLDAAERANEAYRLARDRIGEARDFWTRLGLFRQNPEARLENSGDSFQDGDFELARERARSAEAMIEDAGRTAQIRALIAGAVLAGLLLILSVVVWLARRRAAAA